MSSTDFYVDFESDVPAFDNRIREAAKMRLRDLALPHNDIDHATVTLARSEEDQGPGQFQARVKVFAHPGEIAVTQKAYRIVEAMDKALAEVERLIHERYRS